MVLWQIPYVLGWEPHQTPYNPAWVFMLRKKKKNVKYEMLCTSQGVHLGFYIRKITTLDNLKALLTEGRVKVNYENPLGGISCNHYQF